MRILLLLLFLPILLSCRRSEDEPMQALPDTMPERVDVLALGDSYTKGEGVKWEQNFPNQLADSLRAMDVNVTGVHVVAQTGWRTDNLQSELTSQSGLLLDSVFSLVTLCIGVNNQFQNANFETFKTQFEALLQYAIERAGGRKERVVVVSIPDWSFTPLGQSWGNPALTSQQIDQYNTAKRAIAGTYGVHYVNVTEVSRQGLEMPDWVAADGLHPSGKQYTEWVKLMLPVLKMALKNG
jgi:lysophospholipase L1-like esterase